MRKIIKFVFSELLRALVEQIRHRVKAELEFQNLKAVTRRTQDDYETMVQERIRLEEENTRLKMGK